MLIIFTGHRPQSLHGGFKNTALHKRIKLKINEQLQIIQPDIAISGMALGLDQWAAEECISLSIPFIAALPFEGQEQAWPPKSQEHYQWILSKAQKVVYVDRERMYINESVPPGVYHPCKMLRRNDWMADQMKSGDTLLSLYNGVKKGGTYKCINDIEIHCQDIVHVNIHPEHVDVHKRIINPS